MTNSSEIARETLSSRVCAHLRQEILSGTLRAGERLSENMIAGRLGVSPTPVREAMRLLIGDGIVEYVDRKGVRVIELSEREIRQAFSVRNALERLALQEAFPQMSQDDRQRLLVLARSTEDARDHPANLLFELDRRFHAFLVDRSGNPWLREFSGKMGNVLTVARLELFNEPEIDKVVAEHVAIAAAILDGDLDRADRELDSHIRRVCANAISAHRRHHESTEVGEKGAV
jgi:DNA-binding GntR family transcriptional regulator